MTTQTNNMCRTTLFINIIIIRIQLLMRQQFLLMQHRAIRKKSHRLRIEKHFRKSSGVIITTTTLHSSLI